MRHKLARRFIIKGELERISARSDRLSQGPIYLLDVPLAQQR